MADELRERIKNYRETRRTDDLLINWFVDVPPGPLATNLRRGKLTEDLLSELRTLYGGAGTGSDDSMVWSVSISLLLPEKLSKSQYEQQTFLGDFLRSVRHFQENPKEILDLERFVPNDWADETVTDELLLAKKVKIPNAAGTETDAKPEEKYVVTPEQSERRRQVLQEAALIGMELLGSGNSGERRVESGE